MTWESTNLVWEISKAWIIQHSNWNSVIFGVGWVIKFIGGFGGIVFLGQWLLIRPRLAIRRFEEKHDDRPDSDSIRFEAENLGGKTSSILPDVTLSAFSIEAEPIRIVASSRGTSRDRSLNPRVPKTYEFYFPEGDNTLNYLFLKKYTFRLSHRAKYNIYLFLSDSKPINSVEYWFGTVLCKLFGVKALEALAKRKDRTRRGN